MRTSLLSRTYYLRGSDLKAQYKIHSHLQLNCRWLTVVMVRVLTKLRNKGKDVECVPSSEGTGLNNADACGTKTYNNQHDQYLIRTDFFVE